MPRIFVIIAIALSVVISAILISGCSSENAGTNNTTSMPVTNSEGPTVIPGAGTGFTVYGRVYLDGNIVSGAQVEAVSVDGTYRTSNMTDRNGVYHLVLPDGAECNITARYNAQQHTVWPVRVTSGGASFNIYMTTTPKSIIMGKGTAFGGPYGYDASKFNFSGLTIEAVPANANATVTAAAGSDGSYYMEVTPGVKYWMNLDIMPAVSFEFRNMDRRGMAKGTFGKDMNYSLNVTPGRDETSLIDYEIFLP